MTPNDNFRPGRQLTHSNARASKKSRSSTRLVAAFGRLFAFSFFGLIVAACGSAFSDLAEESSTAKPSMESSPSTEGDEPEEKIVAVELTDEAKVADTPVTTAAPAPEPTTTTTEKEPEKGTQDNPFAFGEAHSRTPGFSGAGWTISIDDVVPMPGTKELADGHVCVGIIQSATLDSWSGDELTASGFTLPDTNLINNDGQKSENSFYQCDDNNFAESLGILTKYDVNLIEGGSATFVEAVMLKGADFEDYFLLAIEADAVYVR